MSFWSSLRRIAKKAWLITKAIARMSVRKVITVVHAVVPNALDLIMGFKKWPEKYLRMQIFILTDPVTGHPVVNPAVLTSSIDFAMKTLKEQFNVKLLKYGKDWVDILTDRAPDDAIEPGTGLKLLRQEFGEAGAYFAKHSAGWCGMPTTCTYPLTVFIVKDVKGKQGCSLGPLTDWVAIDIDGAKDETNLMHMIGHACSLCYSCKEGNIMSHPPKRGSESTWYQQNLLRSSRHVNYY